MIKTIYINYATGYVPEKCDKILDFVILNKKGLY